MDQKKLKNVIFYDDDIQKPYVKISHCLFQYYGKNTF